MIAKVLPDLPAVEKAFDYLVPDHVGDQVRVGTIVRVDLHGRRVRGWVTSVDDESSAGVDPGLLKPLTKVSSQGPPAGVVDLAKWAAWRWAGRWVHLLRVASPPGVVRSRPPVPETTSNGALEPTVVRLPPAADRLTLVLDAVAAAGGHAIVVAPAVDGAVRLAARIRREGHRVALLAGDVRTADWEAAHLGGAVVVGTRVGVWAPVPDGWLRSIVVLDEHDEALQSEQAPTWHARDVAVERARREGAACTLVSAVPTLHAAARGRTIRLDPARERAGWPVVEIADRRDEDPVRAGPFSPAFDRVLRTMPDRRVVCVLNRLGRSRLLACIACGEVAACGRCGAHVAQPEPSLFRCVACATERPPVCLACGAARFKNLRMGVTRLREELEALAGEPVVEVTAAEGDPGDARLVVGTEAVLHRLGAASVGAVAFLDLDQELLAPRFRAAEQALVLIARAARAVGGRRSGGRLVLQTRLPEHPAVQAALLGEPDRLAEPEAARRAELGYPPAAAVALVSGAGASAWAEAAVAAAATIAGIEVQGPAEERWLARAPDDATLADFLASVPRPPGRLRIAVDPPRL